MVAHSFLQEVVIALALGALVGLERERVPERKYAGLRTLSLFCGAGPLAVLITLESASVAPVAIYLLLGALFSLLIVYIRMQVEGQDLGLTTSSTVFLMSLVGVLVGYGHAFEAVAVTLFSVFLLSEKNMFTRYTALLDPDELSDAIKLGILALVLYPILPDGAVDPYGVLHLKDALLFAIFILLIQFAAFVSLAWLKNRISFLAAAGLGGVASSLAVVTSMANFIREGKMQESAAVASVVAVTTMVVRNAVIGITLIPALLDPLLVPFSLAAAISVVFVLIYYHRADGMQDISFGADSPFSFRSAFKFGVLFLLILFVSGLAKEYFSAVGIYSTAFLGGIASSTAVVASAATLFTGGSIDIHAAAGMVALGAISSLLSKLVYVEAGGARSLTKQLLVPYLLMSLALLTVFLL